VQPFIKENGVDRLINQTEINTGTLAIQEKLKTFDYTAMLNRIIDRETMIAAYNAAGNGYEKLQLFRVINNENHDNDVVKKYINESFHIENEYIMQLNPHKYDFIPEYIIYECDQSIIRN
jgi:hypothetical protein